MERVFEQSLSAPGGYALNLFTLGVPSTIVVDDMIPFYNGKPMAAGPSADNSLWPMILEKAVAKMRGNYMHIAGGQGYDGIRLIRGGPYESKQVEYMTVEEIWTTVTHHLDKGDTITAGSNSGSDTDTDAWGVVLGHAYTVAAHKTLKNG